MSEYREFLYDLCNSADLDDREDVIDVMNVLAKEALKYYNAMKRCDDKLQELMSYKDYNEWSIKGAKEMFAESIDSAPDEVKDFLKGLYGYFAESEMRNE